MPADIHVCDADGPVLASEQDAVDLIGDAGWQGASWVAIPVERLDPAFFALSNGIAGAFLQKFATYGVGVAIVGDIGRHTAVSEPLADFVRESNAGGRICFVPELDALHARLAA